MTSNAQNEWNSTDEKIEPYRKTNNSISAIIFSLDTIFPEENPHEKIDSIQQKINEYGLENYSSNDMQVECLDSTTSIEERVTIAVTTTCNYIATAQASLLQKNLIESWIAIARANYFYGIAKGIKSTGGFFDDGIIKKNTKRAAERAREGGIRKEANKQIKRKEIIKALDAEKKLSAWKTPEEAAQKIIGNLFKTLHKKNVPLPTKSRTLEKHIIKLIAEDTEAYFAYSNDSRV